MAGIGFSGLQGASVKWASEASLLPPMAPHETKPGAARKTVSVSLSITDVVLMSSLKSRTKAAFLLSGRHQGFMSYGFRLNLVTLEAHLPHHREWQLFHPLEDWRLCRFGREGELMFGAWVLVYWKVMGEGGHTKGSLWGWEYPAVNSRRMGTTGIWSWIPATPA